jgi:hypothetical protein
VATWRRMYARTNWFQEDSVGWSNAVSSIAGKREGFGPQTCTHV